MDIDVDRCGAARQAPRRIPCIGAIITAGDLILLIRRGHEPEAGRWSLPGGRIEAGETDEQALVREVREETGLEVAPGPLIGAVDRARQDGRVLVIRDYAATVTGAGSPRATTPTTPAGSACATWPASRSPPVWRRR